MTPTQSNLLRKARRDVAAANDLFRLGHFPQAISRAYYAMFYVAQAFLEGEGLEYSSHAAVVSAFGRVFSKKARLPSEYHGFLIAAQEDRLRADYDEVFAPPPEEVEIHLRNAERFLQLAEEMIGKPARE